MDNDLCPLPTFSNRVAAIQMCERRTDWVVDRTTGEFGLEQECNSEEVRVDAVDTLDEVEWKFGHPFLMVGGYLLFSFSCWGGVGRRRRGWIASTDEGR